MNPIQPNAVQPVNTPAAQPTQATQSAQPAPAGIDQAPGLAQANAGPLPDAATVALLNEQLFAACCVSQRDIPGVTDLLRAGARAQAAGESRFASHNWALRLNHLGAVRTLVQQDLEGVEALLQAGADLNAKDDMGFTPLYYALKYNTRIALFLIERGARLVDLDDEGCNVLHVAAGAGNVECIEYLLKTLSKEEWEAYLHASQGYDGYTPLDHAVDRQMLGCGPGHLKAALILLQNGASCLGVGGGKGRGNLLHALADMRPEDGFEQTEFEAHIDQLLACLSDEQWTEQIAQFDDNGVRPLCLALRSVNRRLFAEFIRRGASLECLDYTNANVLHVATRNTGSEALKMVLEHLSDDQIKQMINQKDANNQTPLMSAIRTYELYLDYLARNNDTSVPVADSDQLIWLLDNGANCSSPTLIFSFLRDLARYKDLALLDAMLRSLKNDRCQAIHPLDCKDCMGCTPLHVAVECANIDVVNCLLDHGADINLQDIRSVSPVDLAESLRKNSDEAQATYDVLRSAKGNSFTQAQRHMRELSRIVEATHLRVDVELKKAVAIECRAVQGLLDALGELQVTPGRLTADEAVYFQALLAKALDLGKDHLGHLLLEAGYLPAREPAGTTTLLHLAAASNCTLSLERIITCQGPECLSTPDQCGRTPLDAALLSGSQEAIRILLDHGATLGGKLDKTQWLLKEWIAKGQNSK